MTYCRAKPEAVVQLEDWNFVTIGLDLIWSFVTIQSIAVKNFVTLVANGDELRFYSRKDTVVPSNTMEIDFLARRGIKICPIEVKSGRYHAHASLDRFVDKFGSKLGRKYVVCIGEYEERNGVTYLPAYMAYLI